jgi:hypothetical protein
MALPRFHRLLVGSSLAAAALVCACGSRGPLDVTIIEETPATDASVDAHADAATDASDAGDASDALLDVLEAAADTSMPPDGGPLINCATCLEQTCGTQLLTCITSSGCTTALQCVATTCLTGGTPNLQCFLGCANGDQTTETQLESVLGCIIGNCDVCIGVLSSLGGLGGGGGGG